MPRPPRADEKDGVYHALNRGNAKSRIFRKSADYEAFQKVLCEGLERYPVRLYSFEWMPNHWHMVLSPFEDGGMARLLQWVTMTHTQRYHAHYQTTGQGHLYQGRFKSFPVQDDDHFWVVCRYVERNALTAGLVERAEDWRWGSLWQWIHGESGCHAPKLTPWPLPRPMDWIQRVNAPLSQNEQRKIRRCIARGRPLGDEEWVESTARRLNLESTLRARGRPRKFA